jgi:hypothetical protein
METRLTRRPETELRERAKRLGAIWRPGAENY